MTGNEGTQLPEGVHGRHVVEWQFVSPPRGIADLTADADGNVDLGALSDAIVEDIGLILQCEGDQLAIRPYGSNAPWRCLDGGEPVPVPLLSPAQVHGLEAHCRSAIARGSEYGAPLPGVVGTEGTGRDWLEGAVIAGHVPTQEGVELAQRGVFALVRADVQKCLDDRDLDGVKTLLRVAGDYRRQAAMLTEEAARLDAWRGELRDRRAICPPDEEGWTRTDPADDDFRRELAEARLVACIHEVLASTPALNEEQCDRLALLLRGAS